METNIIYMLKINPDPNGTLEVDGERFRVYEEVDPRYKSIFVSEKTKLLDNFANQLRITKAEGNPKRNLEIIVKNTPSEDIS